MLKGYKLGWPAVVLVSVALVTLTLVLLFAPENVQTTVIEWMGWAFLAVSQLMGPIVRRRLQEESAPAPVALTPTEVKEEESEPDANA